MPRKMTAADPSPQRSRLRLSSRSSFWVTSALLFALFGSAAVPAPMYQVYQAKWRFSTTTLTVVFAVYVLTLLVTLLTLGSLSDHVGRRPVTFAALAMAAVAAVLFLTADGVTRLLLARAAQGVAIGLTSGSLVAAMLDLRPQGTLAALVSSLAPTAGLAIGALAASSLVQYGPLPTRLIWWLLLAVFVIGLVLVPAMPEPGSRRPGAIASLTPRLGVPASSRPAFAVAAPCLIGLWALGGFYLSLGPSLTGELLHSRNLVWGGVSICLLMGLGAIVSTASRDQLPHFMMIAGCGGLLLGGVVTVAAIATRTPWLLFTGTAVAGTGFRACLLGRLQDGHRLGDRAGSRGADRGHLHDELHGLWGPRASRRNRSVALWPAPHRTRVRRRCRGAGRLRPRQLDRRPKTRFEPSSCSHRASRAVAPGPVHDPAVSACGARRADPGGGERLMADTSLLRLRHVLRARSRAGLPQVHTVTGRRCRSLVARSSPPTVGLAERIRPLNRTRLRPVRRAPRSPGAACDH